MLCRKAWTARAATSFPDEFEQTLVQSLSAENVVRSLAHVITTASGSHKIPIVATKGHCRLGR